MARTSAISRRLSALKRTVFHLPLRRRSVLGFGLAALLAVAVLGALQFALAAPPAAEPVTAVDNTQSEPTKKDAKPPKDETKPKEKAAQPPKAKESTPETASLRVRVVDEAGKPIAGAKLNLVVGDRRLTIRRIPKARPSWPFPRRTGAVPVFGSAEGYPTIAKEWHKAAGKTLMPAEFTFTLERGRTIGGVVRDDQGKPIPGVKVDVSVSSQRYQQFNMFPLYHVRTDAEGRWHLDHVPQSFDGISIRLDHPDYIGEGFSHSVSAAEQKQIEDRTAVMVMKKGIPVAGTVTDPEGKPVGGATIV